MTQSKINLPSLFMVLSFTVNLIIAFLDPIEIQVPKEIGVVLLVGGFLMLLLLFYS